MLRSEGLLLAYLVVRRRPEARRTVRELVRGLGTGSSGASSIGQRLIRHKVLSPREFIVLQSEVAAARRTCGRCGRGFVVFAGPEERRRRCRCGKVHRIPAGPAAAGGSSRVQRQSASSGAHPTSTRALRQIGPYTIVERVGDGGMGVIYKAVDSAQRPVALKVLRSDVSKDAQTRFQREAEALARLSHPAIVAVHDVGADARGRRWLAMEFVEGPDLEAVRGELDPRDWIELVAQVAEGLHHAHDQGIVHRDVKPHNIIIDARGAPRIADFGLARDLGRSSLTEVGDLVGTPLYMSPEQLKGDPNLVDRRTDIYALGVLLYEALTGRFPLDAKSLFDLQRKAQTEDPLPPRQVVPDMPEELEAILLKALAREPDERYATAAELARDLRAHLAGGDVAVRQTPPAQRVGRRAWRELRSPRGVAAVTVVAIAGIVGFSAYRDHQEDAAAAARRAALEERRGECLVLLRSANATLAEARLALARGEREVAASRAAACLDEVERLRRIAAELGSAAPGDSLSSARQAEREAQRIEAAALGGGGPEARRRARAIYRQLLEAEPDAVDILVGAGRVDLRDGHPGSAFELLNRAATLAPERADARFFRGEAHRLLGRARFALLDYDQALDQVRSLGDVAQADVLVARARARLALGELDLVQADLTEAARQAPGSRAVALARVELLDAQGRSEEALDAAVALAREAPDDPRVRLACGLAWARAGDEGRAREELSAALAGPDPAPEAWPLRARLRSLEGDDAGAATDLEAALERAWPGDPLRRRALLVRARHLRARGRRDEALVDLDAALGSAGGEAGGGAAGAEPGPLQAELLLERAELRLARGDLDGAWRDLDAAATLGRDEPRAVVDRAEVELARSRSAEAAARLRRLLEGEEDARGLALLARLLREAGDPEADAVEARAVVAQRAFLAGELGAQAGVGRPSDEARAVLGRARRLLHRARAADEPARAEVAQALDHARRAVVLAPWLTRARVALVEALEAAGQEDAAAAELAAALEETPGSWGAHALFARSLARRGAHEQALAAYGQALTRLRAAPGSVSRRLGQLFLERARSQQALGRTEDALRDLDAAVSLAPRLVDAFRIRARQRADLGDAAGAAADRERVELLERGYVEVCERAVAEAWELGTSKGSHSEALRALAPAFAVCSGARDPARMANLYLVRAFMRLRNFQLAEAFLDLAGMVELSPQGFQQVYDELAAFSEKGTGIDVEPIFTRIEDEHLVPEELDPDFVAGFVSFLALEFGGGGRGSPRLRAGLRALGRFLDRQPAHPSALLVRSVLYLEGGEAARAHRDVREVLGGHAPPPFAWYQLARIRAGQGEVDGALEALGRALEEHFDAYELFQRDPALDALRGDARYQRLLDLSQGAGYLHRIERVERKALERPEQRRHIHEQASAAATAGIDLLAGRLREGDAEAGLLAARLYLARARQAHRLERPDLVARDTAAALEVSPRVLLVWDQMVEAAEHAGRLPLARYREARPRGAEGRPTRPYRAATPVLLALLAGESVDPDRLAEARAELEREEHAAAYRALLALAAGDAARAQAEADQAAAAPEAEALGAWLTARIEAAAGRPAEALAALERAVEGGLRGPLERDPGLAPLRLEGRFSALTRVAATDRGHTRWDAR